MVRVLPWVLALCFAVLAAVFGLRPAPRVAGVDTDARDRAPSAPAPAERSHSESPASPTPAAGLRTAQACLSRLELVQSSLARCERRSDGSEELPECFDDPAAQAAVEAEVQRGVAQHIEAQRDEEHRARDAIRSAFESWAEQSLELTTEESAGVETLVCAVRELRQRTVAAVDAGSAPAPALDELRLQRDEVLQDLVAMLGEERYAKLRAIGGIGLLSDAVDCG